MSQRKTKKTNSQSHTHLLKTGVGFIAMQAPQCFWIMNAASPKLCKWHHTAELKSSPALTSLPFSASITQAFASLQELFFIYLCIIIFLKKHPKLQNQGTVVSSGSCIRRQYVVSRKLAAGILFVPAVCKTNTAAHCIHSQPPKDRSVVYHSSSSSFKILHTAGYYGKVLLFYFNKTQRPSCALLSAVAGAEVCWMVSR